MFKKSLHFRILFFTIGLLAAGGIISIFWELRHRENELLDAKLRASRFMARPVLNAIYKDMPRKGLTWRVTSSVRSKRPRA